MLKLYRLPNSIPGEEIVQVIRKDLFILFKKIMFMILLIVLPLFFFYIMMLIHPALMHGTISYPLIVLATSAYYLFVWLFFFFSFIDYYLDVWIITNERIIDIEQQGFFSRVISEQRLFRIQDITSEIHGAIPTFLKYGDVRIQTAGTKERFHFHEVPDPNGIRDTIIKLIKHCKAAHPNECGNANFN